MYHFSLIRERKSENQIWVNSFIIDDEIEDPESALRQAIKDFLVTEEGKKAIEETSGDFNWGDIFTYVPDEFLEKRGFRRSWASENLIVNQDEVLCN